MARLDSPTDAHPRAHPSVLESTRRAPFPFRADLVGRRGHRGALPGDLGFQLRAGRRGRARADAPGGRRRAVAGAGRGRDGHVPRPVLPPGGDDGPHGGAVHARPHAVVGPGDGSDGRPRRSSPPMSGSSRWRRATSCGRASRTRSPCSATTRPCPNSSGGSRRRRSAPSTSDGSASATTTGRSWRWLRSSSWRVSATSTTSPRSPRRAAAGWPPLSSRARSSWLADLARST